MEGCSPIWTLDDYLASKKTLLLYDWIENSRDIKSIEEEYNLYRWSILRLAEGFSWLTYSLAAIAENAGWKKERKEDLKKIKILSKRLVEGIKEEGLSLAGTYIPGLSRGYIRKLLREGYNDEKYLKEASEEELKKLLPQRLVKRIQKRMKEEKDNQKVTEQKLIVKDEKLMVCKEDLETEDCKPTTILQISPHRPDRIIFLDKEIKLTPLAFSLVYLLVQNPKEVLTYDYLLDKIWKENEDATYVQVTFHLSKIRRAVLKTIGNNKRNRKKVTEIFKVISRRGVMLNLAEDKLKIN